MYSRVQVSSYVYPHPLDHLKKSIGFCDTSLYPQQNAQVKDILRYPRIRKCNLFKCKNREEAKREQIKHKGL